MSLHEYYHKNPMLASHVAAAVFLSPLHNTQTEGGVITRIAWTRVGLQGSWTTAGSIRRFFSVICSHAASQR